MHSSRWSQNAVKYHGFCREDNGILMSFPGYFYDLDFRVNKGKLWRKIRIQTSKDVVNI